MSSFKKFMYFIYTMLFIATVAMFIYNDSLIATFDQPTMYTFWMFWSLLGFVLLMLESVFENIHLWSVGRSHNRLERENLELKAKLYDQLEGRSPDRINTGKDRSSWRKDADDVVSTRNEGDVIRMRERDGDERIVEKNRPGRKDDIVDLRDEGSALRIRERDGEEKLIPKDKGKSFFGF